MVDALALWGTIGTWAAVLLALVALVGIISLWLVLRAGLSERNRALTAVQDRRQDYVTKGIGFGREIRLRRKTKVPDLKPSFDIPSDESPLGISGTSVASLPWVTGGWNGTTCRTGWAKFCRLLDSYKTADTVDEEKRVISGTNGKLVIYNTQTWLPVSRYWILIAGLLGRYGDRQYYAHVHGPPCRADLDEYQVDISGSDDSSDDMNSSSGDDWSVTSSLADRQRGRRRLSNSTSSGTGSLDISLHALRRRSKIQGLTGSFRKLKLNNNPGSDFSFITSLLQFEIFGRVSTYSEELSLGDMLWLASGFLPLSRRKWRNEIMCL